MKNTLKLALCLILVLGTLFCMTACGEDNAKIAGTYTLYSMEDDGTLYEGTQLDDELSAVGMTRSDMYVTLKADGTGEMYVMGMGGEISFEDGKMWPTNKPENKIAFSVSGNKLTLNIEGAKLVFEK